MPETPDSIDPRAQPPEGAAAGADPALARVRFVLVEPSHVGNIGSCARAVRSMGFARLYVVRARDPNFREAPEAVALAAGAADVLAQAIPVETLAQALQGVHLAFATTGYARGFGPEPVEVRAAAAQGAQLLAVADAELAFVFGPERTGLSNEDVRRCHQCCTIPADPVRASLNLAQAAQVVAYECRRAILGNRAQALAPPPRRDPAHTQERLSEDAASIEQTEAMFDHLEQGLAAIGYLDPNEPKHLMARVRRLLLRARPSVTEVDILRGIASAMVLPRAQRAGTKRPKTK